MQNKNVKIAIVAYNLEMGGVSTVIRDLYNLLRTVKGVKVELLFLDNSYDIPFTNDYVNFNKNSHKGVSFFNKIKKYVRFKNYLKQAKFDYIIDQRFRLNPLAEIFLIKFLYPQKSKIIFHIHSAKLEIYLLNKKWLTNYLYGNAYKIVCCSKGVAKLVKKKYDLNNICVIYNGLDLDVFKKSYNRIFNFEYVIAVGRFHKVKQFDKLILHYSKSNLLKEGVKLVLVGDGDELSYCKNLCQKLCVTDDVVFTGGVSNPSAYMTNALFLILCSKYEGFGMVLLESLACGSPVVSFDLVAGPSEIIIPNLNGMLVENQNFVALTEAMNTMQSDNVFYNRCKAEAKASISKFSTENIKQDWLDLLNLD